LSGLWALLTFLFYVTSLNGHGICNVCTGVTERELLVLLATSSDTLTFLYYHLLIIQTTTLRPLHHRCQPSEAPVPCMTKPTITRRRTVPTKSHKLRPLRVRADRTERPKQQTPTPDPHPPRSPTNRSCAHESYPANTAQKHPRPLSAPRHAPDNRSRSSRRRRPPCSPPRTWPRRVARCGSELSAIPGHLTLHSRVM